MVKLEVPTFTGCIPFWYTQSFDDTQIAALSVLEWQRMKEELEIYNAAVDKFNNQLLGFHQRVITIAEAAYGGNHSITEAIRGGYPNQKQRLNMTSLTGKYNVYQEAARKREQERCGKELLVKAVIFLTEHKHFVGHDYNVDSIIPTANSIRYEELVKETLSQDEGPFDFSGMNCDSDCSWDGESRRCNCGNRRVYWEQEGDFTDMTIRAVAY